MRHLATIQTINDIHAIEGKDKIVLADVLGWHVIVKKDEFNIGDKCIYAEIDSVFPEKPEFEFLRKYKFRIKTMKMGNVYSQGIVFPLSFLPEGNYNINDDVTDLLGIIKYEPVEEETEEIKTKSNKKDHKFFMLRYKWFRRLFGKCFIKNKGYTESFPSFLSKTDETRIQTVPEMLEDKTNEYIVTEKVDGCSMTVALERIHHWLRKDTFEFYVCSRNKRIVCEQQKTFFKTSGTNYYWETANALKLMSKLSKIICKHSWVAIQGELIGPNIQSNKYNLDHYEYKIFNIINSDEGRLGTLTAKKIAESLELDFVPVIDAHFYLPDTVDDMIQYSHGRSVLRNILREGVVVRNYSGTKSFKAVDPEFLIKWKE